MKKKALLLLLYFSAIFLLILFSRETKPPSGRKDIRVLLLYSKVMSGSHQYVLDAYRSVLEEEGIPYEPVTPQQLLTEKIGSEVSQTPALIIPDGICRILPGDIKFWAGDYLKRGGNIWLSFDPGTQNIRGKYLKHAVFEDLLGLNYILYEQVKKGRDAYTTARIRFRDRQSIKELQVPPGKFDDKLYLTGYRYGHLQYPIAFNKPKAAFAGSMIQAWGVTESGRWIPAIVKKKYKRGHIMYINLPLGHLKAYADDLPLRCCLRCFLKSVNAVPCILNVPRGRSGLVVNWHIDSNEDWQSIPDMTNNYYLRPDLRYSLHITAGDFRDKPGDRLGFDACGAGQGLVDLLRCFGTIGSHGGWAHNWFSSRLNAGGMAPAEVTTCIRKNNDCLKTITGGEIREYSAPNGVHPQPLVTDILENLGFLAYYYTGDTGSMPNRTFSNGERLSDRVIAFPIVPLEKAASFYEMDKEGYSQEKVARWLEDLLNYIVRERTLRLIYSHPYDIPLYPEALTSFLDLSEEAVARGELIVEPMSYFADFLQRFQQTQSRFLRHGSRMEIHLFNPAGLRDIAVSVPRSLIHPPSAGGKGWSTFVNDLDYVFTIEEDCHEKVILLSCL